MNLIRQTGHLFKANATLILASSIFCLLPFAFLFSPEPRPNQDKICGQFVKLNSQMGFTLNCDSSGLVNLAKYPKSVFDQGNLLQSRPGVIPTGIVFSIPFIGLSKITGFPPSTSNLLLDARFFSGFVLFNFTLLFSTVFIFSKFAKKQSMNTILVISGIVALVSNFVVKSFVFTPHQQIFNIFIPIATVLIFHFGFQNQISKTKMYLISAGVGLTALLYPSIVLLSGALVIVFLYWNFNLKKINLLNYLPLGAIVALTTLPTILWPILVRWRTGEYFNHAAESYRQFVWVFDGFKNGFSSGIQNIINHISSFFRSQTDEFYISLLIMTLLLVGLFLFERAKRISIFKDVTPYLIALAMVAAFFFLLGNYWDRLSYNIVLVIQFIILILVQKYLNLSSKFKYVPYILLIIIVVRFLILIFQHGPYGV